MTRWRWPRFRPHGNFQLKVISLLLAVGLWSLVPDASVPHVIRNVPVRLANVPSELALKEPFEAELEVWVRGNPARTRDLVPGELSPQIDLFGAFAGENTIAITPDDIPSPLGVTVESVHPSQVRVVLEERVRVELPVNTVIEGNPAEGFQVVGQTVEPAKVAVSGPRSIIERMTGVSTETVNIAGRRRPLVRSVQVLADNQLVQIEGRSTVRLTIDIQETPIVTELDDVPIRIDNATHRTVVNPPSIGVVLRGPPSLLSTLSASNLVVSIDVGGLEPRAADYHLEPKIQFQPASLGERISILALTPQRRVDVHVFVRPPAPEPR